MTYCVAMRLRNGLAFAADTRTNAGVDNIATFRKVWTLERTGERVLVLLSAGNLAISQAVISELEEDVKVADDARSSLMTVTSMFHAARLVGEAIRKVRHIDGPALEASGGFATSMILGGQIGTEEPRLFQLYAEGNFIEATEDTPYLQIGEHKYGKPILDRIADTDMRLGDAATLMLLSFDSTLRSNLSVGMPIDLVLYRRDTLSVTLESRIDQNDPYFLALSEAWSTALRDVFSHLDSFDMADAERLPETPSKGSSVG